MAAPIWGARLARFVWVAVLVAHALGAIAVFRLLPHGFPLRHPRFMLGTAAPLVFATGSLALGVALVLQPRKAVRLLPTLPAFWASLALGLLLTFPVTGGTAARGSALLALFLALLAFMSCRGLSLRAWLPGALLAAPAGYWLALCERPTAPSTVPAQGGPPRLGDMPAEPPRPRYELSRDLVVEPDALRVSWQVGRASVTVLPALELERTSPDGFWSIFAAPHEPAPPIALATQSPNELRLWAADRSQVLYVSDEPRQLRVEAWSQLDKPSFAHLSSFTTVQVTGHERLGLRFSPCPSQIIEVTYAGYPTGAPARFAYVDAERTFHVVQATDAEKGPFTSLAQGKLAREDTLRIELLELDGNLNRAFAELELTDFAAQLSTELSPTAGWGVTENAVQFGLATSSWSSPAHLIFTLASTGVGRGWDSVGHRAGRYRNRILVRSLAPVPIEPDPESPVTAELWRICEQIAGDIAKLKPRFQQLANFDPAEVSKRNGECEIDHSYHTHRSTQRGGWTAQVPEPDPDGVWFHIGVWDPAGPARRSQINTQPGMAVFELGSNNITVLIRDGKHDRRLHGALWSLLRRRGVGAVRH